jgi:hypothetical protein
MRQGWHGIPSIRSAAAAVVAAAVVITVWVSMTLIFDLIFHFHPIFLGLAAGWSPRRVDAAVPGAASIALVVFVSVLGAIVGTTIIESAGGPVDPDGFTTAVTTLGIAAGIYLLYRPMSRPTVDSKMKEGPRWQL